MDIDVLREALAAWLVGVPSNSSVVPTYTGPSSAMALNLSVAFLFALCFAFSARRVLGSSSRLRREVAAGRFLSAAEFEREWLVRPARAGRSGRGLKYEDGPGCYVILSFDRKPRHGRMESYDDVYVGQSVHVCSRVHSHLTGHGNGDVYTDVRNGRHVYVRLLRCPAHDLNALERDLISAFHATRSYNQTRGGARRR